MSKDGLADFCSCKICTSYIHVGRMQERAMESFPMSVTNVVGMASLRYPRMDWLLNLIIYSNIEIKK